MRRFLALKMPTVQDTDEAVNKTFLRLWNYLVSGTKIESVSGLIYTIARGVVADFYKNRKFTVELDFASDVADQEQENITNRAEVSLVRDALEKVRADYREALILRFFEGMPIKEVAKRIKKSTGATNMIIARALAEFRKNYPQI
jgi:RNA polymerase sigma-70 factor (ECF subfamily)